MHVAYQYDMIVEIVNCDATYSIITHASINKSKSHDKNGWLPTKSSEGKFVTGVTS